MNTLKAIPFLLFAILSSTLHGQTAVSGGLFANTTWTAANSPYIVTNDVVVFPGFTLTIEPGVEVRFQTNVKLEVRGDLLAVGTATDSIIFTSVATSPAMSDWNAIDVKNTLGASVDMKYAVVQYSDRGLDVECCNTGGILRVEHSSFRYNDIALSDYSGSAPLYVDRCLFEYNNTAAFRADKIITNSLFRNNVRGVDMERCTLESCEFRGHSDVAIRTSGHVINCLVTDNTMGIQTYFSSIPELRNSVITDNSIGLRIGENLSNNITGNYFCNNEVHNIQKTGQPNIDLSGNCFCDTTTASMHASIFDAMDDVSLGLVTYLPFAASCDTTIYTSVEAAEKMLALAVHPNPVSNRFSVSFENEIPGEVTLALLDINGRIAQHLLTEQMGLGVQNFDFERKNLPAGLYFLRVTSPTGRGYKKVLLQ